MMTKQNELLLKQALKNYQLDVMEKADEYYRQKKRYTTREYIDDVDNLTSQAALRLLVVIAREVNP